MNFYAPENFFFLWSVPVAIAIFWISKQIWKRRLSRIGSLSIIQNKLMPAYRPAENAVRLTLIILILLFSIGALARPQWGEEKRKVQRKGVDVIFLLDTSLSMLAEDIKPNRFEKSKIEIRNILQKLKGDRVGMVAFAGSSFLQSPLTLDYSAFMLFLEAIKVGYIPDPGTSLDHALRLALRSFPEKDNKYKAIILFTDGEDNEGGIDEALEEVKKSGIRVYTIGTGTSQGEPIPLKDENHRKNGFKKDRNGQVVVTKLNQELLEKIAKETGAIYLPSTPSEEEIEILLKHMESLGKREYKEKLITEREDHFQVFLLIAVLLLLAETLIRKTRRISKKTTLALLFLVLLTSFQTRAFAEDPVKLYTDKKYKSAMDVYQKEKNENPDDPTVRYNLGTTLYQLDQFHDAAQELETTAKTVQDPKIKAKTLYNYGNAQYRLGNFDKAIESYQKALELNPDDKDAKYNLEFIQNQKKLFDKKNSDRKNDQSKQKNQKQNQQNQQNQQQNQQNQQNQQQNQQNQQNQQQNQQNQQNQQQNQQNQQNQQQNQQNQQNQQQNQQNQQNQQQNQQNQQNQQQNQGQQNSKDQQNQPQQDQKQDQQDKEKQDQQQKQDQQNQKDQQQKQDQQDKEKQDQQQKQDQQNQQDKEKQDQQDKEKQDQQKKQDQKNQEKQNQQDQKDQQEKNDQKDQGEKNPEKDQTPKPDNDQNNQEPQEPKDQGQTPQQAKQDKDEDQNSQQPQSEPQEEQKNESQEPQQGKQQGQAKRPLQGQMTMENAMQILEALKEGEKDMQDLRRPTTPSGESKQPVKDW